MKKRKLLIAGGGYADIPLIEAAKNLGLHVITSGNRPDELGHAHSHEYHKCDFSDKEALLELATKLNIDAICPCCNDFSALSCAWVAERMGLPGLDSYATMTTLMHKDKFQNFAKKHGLPVASAITCASLGEGMEAGADLDYPVIVKPVDMTGGKGISKVAKYRELESAIRYAQNSSRTPRFIIQEFLHPDSYHHNYVGFINSSTVTCGWSDNEHYYTNKYLVWGMSTPSTESVAINNEIENTLNKISHILHLKPGLIMSQHCVVNGKLKIIEMGRRTPGNLHGKMLELATGLPISEWIIRTALGEDCAFSKSSEQQGFWGEHCIMAPRNGKVIDIEFTDTIKPFIREKLILLPPPVVIEDYKIEKLGIVLLQFPGHEQMLYLSDNMHQYVKVIME